MTRNELENMTHEWISLWCAPVDWALFDQLHADDFIDMSSAGREPTVFHIGDRFLNTFFIYV